MKNRSKYRLEKNIVNDIIEHFREEGFRFVHKIHGDPYQVNGIPDILIVEPRTGRFVGLEVKRPDIGKATQLQYKAMCDINAAKGYATVVTSVEEAMRAIKRARDGRSVKVVPVIADTKKDCMAHTSSSLEPRLLCRMERSDGKRAWLVEYTYEVEDEDEE